jgi:hypothetical protein
MLPDSKYEVCRSFRRRFTRLCGPRVLGIVHEFGKSVCHPSTQRVWFVGETQLTDDALADG